MKRLLQSQVGAYAGHVGLPGIAEYMLSGVTKITVTSRKKSASQEGCNRQPAGSQAVRTRCPG